MLSNYVHKVSPPLSPKCLTLLLLSRSWLDYNLTWSRGKRARIYHKWKSKGNGLLKKLIHLKAQLEMPLKNSTPYLKFTVFGEVFYSWTGLLMMRDTEREFWGCCLEKSLPRWFLHESPFQFTKTSLSLILSLIDKDNEAYHKATVRLKSITSWLLCF